MRAFVFDAGLSSWALRKNLRASAYVASGGYQTAFLYAGVISIAATAIYIAGRAPPYER